MRNFLPPMQALRSFEAAARLGSISKAANELYVTQSAVSKQIKLLESLLGIALFTRAANGISLTEDGQQYFAVVINTLNELNSAGELLHSYPAKQTLLLDVIPSMSHLWFIPKVHHFERSYPNLKIDLINGDGQPDFNQSQADVYIRCLLPTDARDTHIELAKEKLVLVMSPKLLKNNPIKSITDILQFSLIQQTTRPTMWQHFFKQYKHSDSSNMNLGMGFQHFFMSLKAAEEGLGIALIPDFLAKQSINSGLLVKPMDLLYESEYRYFLFSPSYKIKLKKVQDFNQWLLKELSTDAI